MAHGGLQLSLIPKILILLFVVLPIQSAVSQESGNSTITQEGKAIIKGQIMNEEGLAISGVKVKLMLKKCDCSKCPKPKQCNCCPDGLVTLTNSSGFYSFKLSAGEYSLTVAELQISFIFSISSDKEMTQNFEIRSIK